MGLQERRFHFLPGMIIGSGKENKGLRIRARLSTINPNVLIIGKRGGRERSGVG